MPVDMTRYPSNWKKVSLTIRRIAGNHCEWCHVENGIPLPSGRKGKVVLTVAHLGTPYADNSCWRSFMKLCKICGKQKPLTDFPIEATHADGHQNFCKECQKDKNKARYKDNPEKSQATTQRWRETHPEQVRIQHKKWIAANRTRRREQLRVAYADWAKRNPELVKAHRLVNKSRHRTNQLEGFFTSKEWLTLCEECQYKCVSCGKEGNLTPDHIVPLALGGCNHIHNIQPLCLQCNVRKGTKIVDYRALHDKHDIRRENLAALCQRCHLLYDLEDHIEHAKQTRSKKRLEQCLAAGQIMMEIQA